jgi:hypothetical protein
MHVLLEVKVQDNGFQFLPSSRNGVPQVRRRGTLDEIRALLHTEICLWRKLDELSDLIFCLGIDSDVFQARRKGQTAVIYVRVKTFGMRIVP